ncbi:MAG: PKD domain-containing protein [Candidatus Brockarchaeota archaeon]|nr:PKD domain-containing protein [Candidatus Brockarchaeota archaeon]
MSRLHDSERRLFLIFLFLFVVSASSVRVCTADLAGEKNTLLSLINEYRQQNGLQPLRVSSALETAAQLHSDDMALNNYYSHTSLDGRTFVDRIRQAGYTYNTVLGENIAAGIASAQYVFEAWKNSPTHNSIMLDPRFKVIGIGAAYSASAYFKYYWTADFGGYDDSGGDGDENPPPPPPQVNNPPETPGAPSGPASGHVGVSYVFSVSTIDPDGDSLRYFFDWGDGTSSSTGFLESGCVASLSHSWSSPGTYMVRVMAADVKGASSDWSQPASFQVYVRVFEVGFASNVANVSMVVDGARFTLPVVFNWTEGSVHEVSAEGDHNFTNGGRFLFKGWDDGFQERARNIIASGPRVFTVVYETQYLLQISPCPGVHYSEWRSAGETVQLTVNSAIIPQGEYTRLVFAGWSNGEAAQTINLTVNSPLSFEAMWKRQFLVKVHSDYGEAGGGGWCDESSNVNIFVKPRILDFGNGTRRVFDYWFGEGLGSYTGDCLNVTLMVKAPVNETAVWKTQYLVALDSPYGNPVGAGWCDESSRVNVSVGTLFYESPLTRLVFLRWEGAEGVYDANFSIVVNSPLTFKAVWTREFYLNVTSLHGETWGSGWYAEGAVASFGVKPPKILLVAEVFDGWGGDVELRALNATVVMDSPKTVVARWRRDYSMLALAATTVAGVSMLIHFGRKRRNNGSTK